MLIIISQVIGVLCLLTVFGTYASYQKKQREINIEETRIEVDFSEVNVGDVRKVICEILTHIENDIDYVEYRIVCKDGRVKQVRDYGRFVHTELFGDVYYVFVNDITKK